jgi:hypothetical protein
LADIVSEIWKYYLAALCSGLLYRYLLHSNSDISMMSKSLNLLERIALSSSFCLVSYILLVIILYQSTKPVTKFISVGLEMVPNIFSKRA